MAVSDYRTKDIQVGTNAYVKPVNTSVAEAVEVIGSGIAAVNKDRELAKFEQPLRQMEENVMKLGANAPQEALFIQGRQIESRLATGMLSEDQLSPEDKKLLNDSRSMILREDLAVQQGQKKITSMAITAEKWLRDNIRRRPDLAPEFRAIVRNELGMDVEGAAMQDYLAQLKSLEEKDKPALTFSGLNDLLTPIENYAKEYGNATGSAEIAQKALAIRALYATNPGEAVAQATALAAGLQTDSKFASVEAVDAAESSLASIEKDLTDAISKPLPNTEEAMLARREGAVVFKNNLNILREKLAGYSFSAKSATGEKRDKLVERINTLINDYFDPETGEFSDSKFNTQVVAAQTARETLTDKAPLAKLHPIVQFIDEPSKKYIMTAVGVGSYLTNPDVGYIDNPAISSKITGTMVNNGLNALASSAGNTQSGIKNNPEGHIDAFVDLTAPFTQKIYTDKARQNRIFVPATEFMSAGSGVLPRIARSLGPNGYVDKLYNESGDPEVMDLALAALMTRASETMYRELGRTNLAGVVYTRPDGTTMSSAEVLRTYFAPADYETSVSNNMQNPSKTYKLTTEGVPVIFRPSAALNALPEKEKKKVFAVWDAYNAEAERRFPVGVDAFSTIFYRLNDRVTGGGTK